MPERKNELTTVIAGLVRKPPTKTRTENNAKAEAI